MDNTIVSFLLEHNKKQSKAFAGPDATLSRRRYRAEHPTEIAALKCMDGRLNLAVITETPPGTIQPLRNIGGMFDLGWPFFGEVFGGWVRYSVGKGRRCLALATYHFSKGDVHRGCAGHKYDTDAAKKCAIDLKAQIERVYGEEHETVYPVVVGIETDEDGLVIHGRDGETIDLSTIGAWAEEELRHRIEAMFPDMHPQMVVDFMPLLRGNLRHIAKIRESKRPIEDAEHKEQIIAVGRGFDWLHIANKALIIGPYSYNLGGPIGTAGKIILSNFKDGRIRKEEGIALLTSAAYRDEAGEEPLRAIEKALSLARFSLETLEKEVPELVPHIQVVAGIVNTHTRLFTRIPFTK